MRPGLAFELALKALFAIGRRARVVVEVADGPRCHRFLCTTWHEVRRATTLLVKEPGTITWLAKSLRPGDTLLDVGANIGVYTIYAAHLHSDVRVFAVEPHLLNAARLIENVKLNALHGRVRVLAIGLCDELGANEFHYHEWSTGSSRSTLGQAVDQRGRPFVPTLSELKLATSIDDLVERGVLPPPALVKIDVDGVERAVVAGMARLLRSPEHPRAVQVEVGPKSFPVIADIFARSSYRLDHRHYSQGGQKRLERGESAESVDHNAVFVPES